jgi:signal transduction histidine kinase
MATGAILIAMLRCSPLLLRHLLLVAVYNTAIGLFLSLMLPYGVVVNLIYSQCIGFGIYAAMIAMRKLRSGEHFEWRDGVIGIPAGFALGFALATWINGYSLAMLLAQGLNGVAIAAATASLFGILGTWHFRDESRLREAQAEAAAERAQRVEQEGLATRAELARLQAQIEPHFLFNTLSNVVGLIDTDAPAARKMLLDLTALLRTSLARTRKPVVTLGEELDLLRAYLGIMAVRMGTRLEWRIDADADTLAAQLPPLLVQPLVENAIRHGLEPKTEAGRLDIRCRRQGDMLDIEVGDNGLGIRGDIRDGTGLSNIRQRLAASCGPQATLSLTPRPEGGLIAHLRLPFHDHEPADR